MCNVNYLKCLIDAYFKKNVFKIIIMLAVTHDVKNQGIHIERGDKGGQKYGFFNQKYIQGFKMGNKISAT